MRLVVIAGAIAALIALVGTPLLIRILARHGCTNRSSRRARALL